MIQPTLGHIREDSPRAEHWRRIFGGTSVPLRSPIPVEGVGPDGTGLFYLADVSKLTSEQIDRVVAHVTERFGLSAEEVRADLRDVGLPILATDVGVSFDARLVL